MLRPIPDRAERPRIDGARVKPHRQPPVPQRPPQGQRADRTFISRLSEASREFAGSAVGTLQLSSLRRLSSASSLFPIALAWAVSFVAATT